MTKRFGDPAARSVAALDGVSLAIGRGEFFALLGPSGCGKTTLLRVLAGFAHPDTGEVCIDGRSVLGTPPNKRPVNIVFQSYALFPHMSVADNVAFGLANLGMRGAALRERVAATLRMVQLGDMADRRPSALSGGQQQRVALARALAPQPRLLLLDEPLSALDPQLRRGMQGELKRIQRETGITFLLVTHDREEALSLSDRLAIMDGGRIQQTGSPEDIFERPRSRFVAAFTGCNVVAGSLVGLPGEWAIRPERVRVQRSGFAAPAREPGTNVSAAEFRLPARVQTVSYLGARTACTLGLADGTELDAERDDLPNALTAGDDVDCHLARADFLPLTPST